MKPVYPFQVSIDHLAQIQTPRAYMPPSGPLSAGTVVASIGLDGTTEIWAHDIRAVAWLRKLADAIEGAYDELAQRQVKASPVPLALARDVEDAPGADAHN